MTEATKAFDDLQAALASGGVDAALAELADQMRAAQRYDELFEALLMQGRHRLGLPTHSAPGLDELSNELRDKMEDVYLDACREVGTQWLEAGQLRRAWTYLHPVGDRAAVAKVLEQTEPSGENVDQYVEVAVHGGVHPEAGFRAVLAHYGTCNAITLFEGTALSLSRGQQQDVAALLVRHLHGELMANLRAEIERRESAPAAGATMSELLAGRDWLFAEDNYHIDSSHLAATVRFARLCHDAETLCQAVELTDYGRRLSRQYQFPGEEPFADVYPASALFFRAQLGEQVEEAVEHFRGKAEAFSPQEHGTAPAETLVTLLARLGRHDEALEAAVRWLPPGTRTSGFAPGLLELSRAAGRYEQVLELCRQRDDLVGFAAALLSKRADRP